MADTQRCFELLGKGGAEGLRHLLEEDPGTAEARDASGVSLLMHALYRGRHDLAELIAGKKKQLDIFEAAALGKLERLRDCAGDVAAINSRSNDGFTALHFACYFGQPDAARLLMERGALVGAVSNNPMKLMPLHSAASSHKTLYLHR
jgi:ankyrin repeat protein